jgi:rhodanese-related sulfurtransferase
MSSCQNYSGGRQTGNGTFETISKTEFKKKMKEKANHALIDVLTPSEYQKGTIGNAKKIRLE